MSKLDYIVKLKAGQVFCSICQLSVRETFLDNHLKTDGHLSRLEVLKERQAASEPSGSSEKPHEVEAVDTLNTEEESESESEFRNERTHEIRMPELIPITGSDDRIVVSDLTALDLADEEPFAVYSSTPPPFPSESEPDEGLLEQSEKKREEIASTIQQGLERRVKKPKLVMGDSDDEEDWRSKSV